MTPPPTSPLLEAWTALRPEIPLRLADQVEAVDRAVEAIVAVSGAPSAGACAPGQEDPWAIPVEVREPLAQILGGPPDASFTVLQRGDESAVYVGDTTLRRDSRPLDVVHRVAQRSGPAVRALTLAATTWRARLYDVARLSTPEAAPTAHPTVLALAATLAEVVDLAATLLEQERYALESPEHAAVRERLILWCRAGIREAQPVADWGRDLRVARAERRPGGDA